MVFSATTPAAFLMWSSLSPNLKSVMPSSGSGEIRVFEHQISSDRSKNDRLTISFAPQQSGAQLPPTTGGNVYATFGCGLKF
jgi:hypothetical protein